MRQATEISQYCSKQLQFGSAFALFVREADFQSPDDALPLLSRLRELAALNGDAESLAGLHLAVARLECCRGHCVDAHRHLQLARELVQRSTKTSLACMIDIVGASLEVLAGNLSRAKFLAEECFKRANVSAMPKYIAGAAANGRRR